MSKTLVIAEKPSVAQDIVRALTPSAGKFEKHDDHFENDNYVVTSAVGHLVEIQAPEEFDVKRGKWSFAHLPVIPPPRRDQGLARNGAGQNEAVVVIGMLADQVDAARRARDGRALW